ncbi:uncharacterized protein LOC144449941 isoform X2 [Glandiceps talaboti]
MATRKRKNPQDLIDAVKSGDIEKVKFYLEKGYDVNYKDESDWDKRTSLHYGAEEGHLDICKLLLEAKAKVNAVDIDKRTSLHYAAISGHFDICKLLLEAGAKIDAVGEDKRTSLHYAANSGHFDICKLLLEAGAKIDAVGELLIAAGSGNIEKVKSCLENGYGVNDTNESWENKTSLHYAAKNQHLDIFKLLLDAGAERDNEDLIVAVKSGDIEKVKFYLKNGYDVNSKDDRFLGRNKTSLHYAAQNQHLDIFKLLLDAGAERDNEDLIVAAADGDIEKVKFCLENGYDVNYGAGFNKTSLHYGAEKGYLDICKLLLEAGAQVNAANDEKRTSLHYGAEKGYLDICKLLLKAGAQVNAADIYKRTSLHLGAQNGHLDICKLLLEAGAQVNEVNIKMRRPFS